MKAIEVFGKNFERAEGLLRLHKLAQPKGRPSMGVVADDILRATIVFASAALDSYIHKRIEEVAGRILKDKRLPFKMIVPLLRTMPKKSSVEAGGSGDQTTERDVKVAKYFLELGFKSSNRLVSLVARSLSSETFKILVRLTVLSI